MKVILVVLALALTLATALPLLRFDQWWIRALDFPRVQIAVAGFLVLVCYLFFWKTHRTFDAVVLGLLVLSVGYQLIKIFPYTVLMPRQVLSSEIGSDGVSISLLVANVLMENRKSDAFLDIVHQYDPDIIVTIEPDNWWEQALRPLEKAYPYTLKSPLDNTYGMLVYSRLELIDPQVRFVLQDTIPSMHMQVALASGERVFMHFVHPDPPNPKHATQMTERDAELLIVGREVEERGEPTIIAGDFNDVSWSHTTNLFQKASGLLDPRIGRGMYNTFNAANPLLRWPLDHVFHSDHFQVVRLERAPAWGSDHFPLFIELNLAYGAKSTASEETTDAAEEEQVDEKIEDGKQKADD